MAKHTHSDTVANEPGHTGPGSDEFVDDATDPLLQLRGDWATHGDLATVEAATIPLSAAEKQQIVARLLEDRRRVNERTARMTGRLRSGAFVAAIAAGVLVAWIGRAGQPHEFAAVALPLPAATPNHAGDATAQARHVAELQAAADQLTALADAQRNLRRFAEAEALYKRALEIRQQALGPQHVDVAASLTQLAELYASQHLYAKAKPLYQRAYEIQPTAVF